MADLPPRRAAASSPAPRGTRPTTSSARCRSSTAPRSRRRSRSCSRCRSASASRCSPTSSRRAACAGRSIYLVDLLAAIPSVVYGLWALAVLEKPGASTCTSTIADTIGKLPVLGRVFGGVAERRELHDRRHRARGHDDPDRHRDQPRGARDRRRRTTRTPRSRWARPAGRCCASCVFPRARSGLVGAVMLGMGRALGETIAVALVIGSSQQITSHLFQPGDSMAAVIAHEFGEAASDAALPRRADRPRRAAVRVHADRQRRWPAGSRTGPTGGRRDDRHRLAAAARRPSCPTGCGERSTSPRRRVANGARVGVDDRIGRRRARAARLHRVLRRRQGHLGHQLVVPHQEPADHHRAPGRRDLARDRRHAAADRSWPR